MSWDWRSDLSDAWKTGVSREDASFVVSRAASAVFGGWGAASSASASASSSASSASASAASSLDAGVPEWGQIDAMLFPKSESIPQVPQPKRLPPRMTRNQEAYRIAKEMNYIESIPDALWSTQARTRWRKLGETLKAIEEGEVDVKMPAHYFGKPLSFYVTSNKKAVALFLHGEKKESEYLERVFAKWGHLGLSKIPMTTDSPIRPSWIGFLANYLQISPECCEGRLRTRKEMGTSR